MVKLVSAIALAVVLAVTGEVRGALLSAPAMYADAQAKEAAVRRALIAGQPAVTMDRAIRTVLRSYEALVRQYPTSSYCDDALWNAARLAMDASKRLGDGAHDATASRLLRQLASQYPSSKHVKQVPPLLASLDAGPATAPGRGARHDGPGTQVQTLVAQSAAVPASVPVPIGTAGAPPADTAAATEVAPSRASEPPPAGGPLEPPPASVAAAPPLSRSAPSPTRRSARPVPRPTPVPGGSMDRSSRPLATLTGIHRSVLPDVVRLTLEIDAETPFRQEELTGPPRLFFDLSATRPAPDLRERTIRFDGDRDIVRHVRIGRQPNDTTRVVLETEGTASCNASPTYSPYRLVVDCVRASARASTSLIAAVARPTPRTPATLARKPPAAPPAPLGARSTVSLTAIPPVLFARAATPLLARTLPAGRPAFAPAEFEAALAASTVAPAPVLAALASSPLPALAVAAAGSLPSTPATAAERPAPAAPLSANRNLNGGLSMARQLGLSVSRIVIDPGHGGHDPGAKGPGVGEAELVLDIALRLEALLEREPGVEVILTRRTDEFVSLGERTAIANRETADLFLSIHANASPAAQAGGVETYFLNFANTPGAAAVAARENAASGQPMSALPDFVKAIALNNKLDESRDFATLVQRSLIQKLRGANKSVRDLGVKQAPFVVLIGAAMPSVLTEVSFVTNAREAKLLKGTNYRQRIAEALFAAVQKYQASLNRERAVAQQ
jgi:N-acetylmuramoyl-L-alanine amidase